MKKVKKSGSGVVKKFKSFYAVQLGFLSPVLEMRVASASSLEESESQNLEESEVSVTEDNSDDPITVTSERDVIHSKKVEKQKSKTSALETKLLTFLDCPPKPTPVEDEDKSFFDSLLPTLRTFDTDQKLEFRAEILRILQRIRRSKSQICSSLLCTVPCTYAVFSCASRSSTTFYNFTNTTWKFVLPSSTCSIWEDATSKPPKSKYYNTYWTLDFDFTKFLWFDNRHRAVHILRWYPVVLKWIGYY